jgi:anti-sigma factor RsiW
MDREGVHDLVAAYALDALDGEDRQTFDEHLETCERCRDDVLALSQTAAALAYAPEGPAPPEALRGRIIEAVRSEPGAKVIPFPRFRRPVWIASVAAAAWPAWRWDSGSGRLSARATALVARRRSRSRAASAR